MRYFGHLFDMSPQTKARLVKELRARIHRDDPPHSNIDIAKKLLASGKVDVVWDNLDSAIKKQWHKDLGDLRALHP